MAYQHSPLRDANSIRLLQIEAGGDVSPLEASLKVFQLGSHCPYEALSYAWGKPDSDQVILVDDRDLSISTTLHMILSHLRLSYTIRTVWIDAICIDQQNVTEKADQVVLMGQIYRQARVVLCWLGDLTVHRRSALEYFQALSNEKANYFSTDEVEHLWTSVWSDPTSETKAIPAIKAASDAHVEAIYQSDWFNRMWILQEVSLAVNPMIVCGRHQMSWKEFETATRIVVLCLRQHTYPPKNLRSIESAWDLIQGRARYQLNMRPTDVLPLHFQVDQKWSVGRVAWDMRHKQCKDDRDRVYALSSMTSSGNSLKLFNPRPFTPDYTRSTAWAYTQFWARFGGATSVAYAGLARRSAAMNEASSKLVADDASEYFGDDYLPSWVPDLRPQATKAWEPMFGTDYGASTPFQHMAISSGIDLNLMYIRGHRFDKVVRGFEISEDIEPCRTIEAFIIFRAQMRFFLSLQAQYEPYPTGRDWVEALGCTVMMEMPYDEDHPFRQYLNTFKIKLSLSQRRLKRLWKQYIKQLLADSGSLWGKLRAGIAQKVTQWDPATNLKSQEYILWILHKYIADVLRRHRLIITQRGYMGLAPPGTSIGDVVAVLGGPSVPFVLHDLNIHVSGELIAQGPRCTLVHSEESTFASQLVGPCYLHGIMKGEFLEEAKLQWPPGKPKETPKHKRNRDFEQFEWEADDVGVSPVPTLCLL